MAYFLSGATGFVGNAYVLAYALFPKAVDPILSAADKVLPHFAAATGERDPEERGSTQQVTLAHPMRGGHG